MGWLTTKTRILKSGPLFRNLVRREVRQRYKGSALGLTWTLINPLIMVGAYWIVFKFLFGSPIPNYALFMFVGLMVWTLFYGGITAASSSLVGNASLVTKVRFPRELIPLSTVTANSVIALAMLVIAIPLCIVLGSGSLLPLVLLAPVLALTAVMTAGVGLLVSALNVYFRDVEHILMAIGVPWFFLSPILYTFATLPTAAQDHQTVISVLHYGNPIAPFIIVVQDVLFFGQWPTMGDSLYCAVAAVAALVIGISVFNRLEGEMAVEL